MKLLLAVILLLIASPVYSQQQEMTPRELLSIFNERNIAINQRFEAQEKQNALALTAAKEAVAKAETAAEKRFDSVNEFRGQLKDQAATFMPRAEVEIRLKPIDTKLVEIDQRLTQIVSRAEGSAQLWQGITVALGLVLTSILVFFAVRRQHPTT